MKVTSANGGCNVICKFNEPHLIHWRNFCFALCTEKEKNLQCSFTVPHIVYAEDRLLINTLNQRKSIYNWMNVTWALAARVWTLASPKVSTLDEEFWELRHAETQNGGLFRKSTFNVRLVIWRSHKLHHISLSICVCFVLLYSSFPLTSFHFLFHLSFKTPVILLSSTSTVTIISLPYSYTNPYQQNCFYSLKAKAPLVEHHSQ